MTGVKFLFRVTLRRLDLAAEIYHLKEPERLPRVLSPDEVKRLLTMAPNLQTRVLLTLAYGCGLRAGEVVHLTGLMRQRRCRAWCWRLRISSATTVRHGALPMPDM